MSIPTNKTNKIKYNGAFDIAKLVMAIMVIGMHTEPFGFSFWLNKGFSICRRLCVPFFFVTSGYFFYRKEKSLRLYIQRIATLYVVWSIIYLPYNISELRKMTVSEILRRFFWDGNKPALWYLWATIIGISITSVLLHFFKPKYVLMAALICLIIGGLKTTYSIVLNDLFKITMHDYLGSRNGLYYGFPYIALGMAIAKSDSLKCTKYNTSLIFLGGDNNTSDMGVFWGKYGRYVGFLFFLFLLVVESYVFDICFKSESNLIKVSVYGYTYFFFEIVRNAKVELDKSLSLTFRRMSTLMYVSQFLFIPVLRKYLSYLLLFFLTVFVTGVFSFVIIKISEKKGFRFLKNLY